MNIGQIRYFVAVYQAGSFSQAAKAQFITVQAVSKSIADLESEIGRELFERRSRGVEPTPFGTAFYQKAVNALVSFDELQAFATGQVEEPAPSNLNLGLCAPQFKNNTHVLATVGALLGSRIGAPVEVSLTSGYEGLDRLRKGEFDALITIGPLETPHTDCVSALSTPTAVSLFSGHPLASKKTVTLDELADYPVIVDPDLDFFNTSILATYVERGLKSERRTPKSQEDLMDHFMKNNGYAFSVAQAALADDRFGSMIIPIDPKDAVEVPICLVTSKYGKKPLYLKAEIALLGKQPISF